MNIVQFEPKHLEELLLQPSQALMQPVLSNPDYGRGLASAGPAFTGIAEEGVIACMGLIPQWQDRAIAWGLISAEAGRHFVQITKAVFRTMELYPYRRIEASVLTQFEQGHRWAKLLGFKRECTMKAYLPNGDDCDLYARVKWKSA